MELPDSSILTNILLPVTLGETDLLFEKKYIAIRSMENRIYTDAELMYLPEIHPAHPHYGEWQIRKRTGIRLMRYLGAKHKPLRILEVGCGNGWLSNLLASLPETEVTGSDINFTELQQAARVFSNKTNLRFVHGDFRTGMFGDAEFDLILFAASMQYFSSLPHTVRFSLQHLSREGEVHITDTHLYKPEEMAAAKARSDVYYESLGYPEMSDFYFHHCSNDLKFFHHTFLFNPLSFRNRIFGGMHHFPWICIRN